MRRRSRGYGRSGWSWAWRTVHRSLFTVHGPFRLLPERVDGRLVLPVLGSVGPLLGPHVRQEIAISLAAHGVVLRQVGGAAADEVAEEMARLSRLDRVGQSERGGDAAHLKQQPRRV